ncbi:pyridoxamine 5'-phosphate oxidase-domain-containing protein [Geopyxis carbonaria]|nr:pyridoxamine 5'-phosphate oxidase-domain-containing protein [Geopyxis carbonaria]
MKYLAQLPLALHSLFGINTTSTLATSPASETAMTTPAMPPWKPLLHAALASQPVNYLQLATVAAPLVPRVRTLTLAGWLGEIPYSKDSPVPASERNPATGVSSDVLVVASDARDSKFRDLEVSSSVEAAFFVAAKWTQWRVRGRAYAIAPGPGAAATEGGRIVAARVRCEKEKGCGDIEACGEGGCGKEGGCAKEGGCGCGEEWTLEREVRKVWDRQDPVRFQQKFGETTPENPVPADFRLLVIVPEEAEELAPGGGPRTWAVAEEGEKAGEWELK